MDNFAFLNVLLVCPGINLRHDVPLRVRPPTSFTAFVESVAARKPSLRLFLKQQDAQIRTYFSQRTTSSKSNGQMYTRITCNKLRTSALTAHDRVGRVHGFSNGAYFGDSVPFACTIHKLHTMHTVAPTAARVISGDQQIQLKSGWGAAGAWRTQRRCSRLHSCWRLARTLKCRPSVMEKPTAGNAGWQHGR
ncbi:hypothetical protein EJ02DRAFT_468442 [Clathrospora elynae]|uniref:Uncharacterized protein n=1 Tax=Clathrospora elynae TaxID=706981 RepID=A0A6A5SI53_9PLEO|nr:hypothetical protein EJ02DRAFT_468442 [Clathrospora elynae]